MRRPERHRRALFAGSWTHWTAIERMTIRRMEPVGIVVDDLASATEFFVELGRVLQGEGLVEGRESALSGVRLKRTDEFSRQTRSYL